MPRLWRTWRRVRAEPFRTLSPGICLGCPRYRRSASTRASSRTPSRSSPEDGGGRDPPWSSVTPEVLPDRPPDPRRLIRGKSECRESRGVMSSSSRKKRSPSFLMRSSNQRITGRRFSFHASAFAPSSSSSLGQAPAYQRSCRLIGQAFTLTYEKQRGKRAR